LPDEAAEEEGTDEPVVPSAQADEAPAVD